MPSHSQGRKEKWAATATLDEEEEPGQDAQVRTRDDAVAASPLPLAHSTHTALEVQS